MRKIIRRILGCVSFTAVMFTFQACYGTPVVDYREDAVVFRVLSSDDESPVPDVKIYRAPSETSSFVLLGHTDIDGFFNEYNSFVEGNDSFTYRFVAENDDFASTDTVLDRYHSDTISIHLLKNTNE